MKSSHNQSPEDIYKRQNRPVLHQKGKRKGRRRRGGGGSGRTGGTATFGNAEKDRGALTGLWVVLALFLILVVYFVILLTVRRSQQLVVLPGPTPSPAVVETNRISVKEFVPSLHLVPVEATNSVGYSFAEEFQQWVDAWNQGSEQMTRLRVTVKPEEQARALESLLAVSERTPDWLRMNKRIAELTFDRGDYSNAVTRLMTVLRADPDQFDFRRMLAVSLLKTGDLVAAEDVARWGLKLSPFSAEMHEVIASSSLARGQIENALPHLRTIAETSPMDMDRQIPFAQALADSGRYERAVIVFDKILSQNPTHAQSYFHYAICHNRHGHPDRAIEVLERAVGVCGSSFVRPWLNSPDLKSLRDHPKFPRLQQVLQIQ